MKGVGLELPQPQDRDFAQRLYEVERSLGARIYELETRQASLRKQPVPPAPPAPLPPDALQQRSVGSGLQRQRTLHRAIDETYFHVEIEPGVGGLQGASTVDATTLAFTFEDFPAAALTLRRRHRRLREHWIGCGVRFNLWYTSPVGSTNNFTVGMSLRQTDAGGSLAATVAPVNVNFNAPGPAAANVVLFATYYVPPPVILPALKVCQFSVRRVGPDANANAFRFIFAEFVMEEVA